MRIQEDVLAVIGSAATNGCNLVLTGQLDRKMYERVNKVLEAVGSKWVRKVKAHVFPMNASDAVENLMLTGKITLSEKFGYFPTPPSVVARLLELARIESGMQVLEPSAGQGAIAFPLIKAGALVHCYELQRQNIAVLGAETLGFTVTEGDFLDMAPEQDYDRVVMNPPFEKQADIKHVLHALQFLKPGGRLVSVMSSSVKFRENRLTAEFRDLVYSRGGSMEDLPENSFKESGTGVNTVIVVIPG